MLQAIALRIELVSDSWRSEASRAVDRNVVAAVVMLIHFPASKLNLRK